MVTLCSCGGDAGDGGRVCVVALGYHRAEFLDVRSVAGREIRLCESDMFIGYVEYHVCGAHKGLAKIILIEGIRVVGGILIGVPTGATIIGVPRALDSELASRGAVVEVQASFTIIQR